MADRYSKCYVMSALYLLRTVVIGAFVTLPVTEYTAAIFGGAIGFCWLGTVPLTSGLVRQIFELVTYRLYTVWFSSLTKWAVSWVHGSAAISTIIAGHTNQFGDQRSRWRWLLH